MAIHASRFKEHRRELTHRRCLTFNLKTTGHQLVRSNQTRTRTLLDRSSRSATVHGHPSTLARECTVCKGSSVADDRARRRSHAVLGARPLHSPVTSVKALPSAPKTGPTGRREGSDNPKRGSFSKNSKKRWELSQEQHRTLSRNDRNYPARDHHGESFCGHSFPC